MKTYSHYGIGVKVHAIEQLPEGRVPFTLWFTVFFIPLFPLSSWSAVYGGEFHDPISEDTHTFSDCVRIKRGVMCHLQTFARSLLILTLAITPAGYLIHRTMGRAATDLEMIFVFASAVWPVLLIGWIERKRRKLLRRRQT